MQPLITVFPDDAVVYLLPLLRGAAPTSLRQAATAAENVVSFGLNLAIPPDASIVKGAKALPTLSLVEVASHLETAKAQSSGMMTASLSSIPWASIVQALMPLILQWLSAA